MANSMQHTDVWTERYGHVCPSAKGSILKIGGVGRKDTYNVAINGEGDHKILAFRCEPRSSFAWARSRYHPVVYFAREQAGAWAIDRSLPPFDMMEDPCFFMAKENNTTHLIFGGVVVRREGHQVIPQTLFFRGNSVATLEREPFAVLDNIKDTRLLQLPDGRFLLMRRPWGGEFGRGRITLHIIDSLADLSDVKRQLPTLAILDDCADVADWVGVNEAHILTTADGTCYIGLLGHVAFKNHTGKHYAACTYTMPLSDILDNQVRKLCPHIIATRSCFETGPAKMKGLQDVVFPGHLEHLEDARYRLWAGLSDARIGMIEIENPFQLPTA